MSALMFQTANAIMNVAAGIPLLTDSTSPTGPVDIEDTQWAWVGDIVDAINVILYPLLILLATAGVIYAIILGVKLARAESADEQQEAKKRLVNFIIGLVAVIALILLMKLVCEYLPQWAPELWITIPSVEGN